MVALKDSDAQVRSQAAWALGLKGDSRAVESLVEALKDTDGHTRSQAAWALGLKGDYRAVEALSAATKDDNNHVRKQATWALGMILMRDRRAANMNIKLEVDPN
jgi:HEAT repeat protein